MARNYIRLLIRQSTNRVNRFDGPQNRATVVGVNKREKTIEPNVTDMNYIRFAKMDYAVAVGMRTGKMDGAKCIAINVEFDFAVERDAR
jgi:hypothetical protein